MAYTHEQCHCGKERHRDRQDNPEENDEFAGAVNVGGFLQLAGNFPEERDRNEQEERAEHRRYDIDAERIQQTDRAQHHIVRNQAAGEIHRKNNDCKIQFAEQQVTVR
ncbi:hypothetical protein D3C73_1242170 [compost metagenome]